MGMEIMQSLQIPDTPRSAGRWEGNFPNIVPPGKGPGLIHDWQTLIQPLGMDVQLTAQPLMGQWEQARPWGGGEIYNSEPGFTPESLGSAQFKKAIRGTVVLAIENREGAALESTSRGNPNSPSIAELRPIIGN